MGRKMSRTGSRDSLAVPGGIGVLPNRQVLAPLRGLLADVARAYLGVRVEVRMVLAPLVVHSRVPCRVHARAARDVLDRVAAFHILAKRGSLA